MVTITNNILYLSNKALNYLALTLNLSILSVPDEGYSRNSDFTRQSCALNLISTKDNTVYLT
jgi:hypothetical protein